MHLCFPIIVVRLFFGTLIVKSLVLVMKNFRISIELEISGDSIALSMPHGAIDLPKFLAYPLTNSTTLC